MARPPDPRYDLLVRGRRVVLAEAVRPATIAVRAGRIAAIEAHDWGAESERLIDAGELAVLPGLVDTHVHVNDPGTDWEGFACAGRAAAAGGITTIVDMPLNSDPVTIDLGALEAKRSAARACAVDHAFWGGLVPGNTGQLAQLLDAGVRGIKCFLCPSGLAAFGPVGERELEPAMQAIAARNAVLLAHAEDPGVLERAADSAEHHRAPRDHASWLRSRPPEAEVRAIEMLASLAARTGCRVHIVHVASAEAAQAVQRARRSGAPLSAETCPHYLTFAAEDIGAGATAFKCAPPIRERAHREALWNALAAGTLDLVASDHSPCTPNLKCLDSGDFRSAWGGIASLQLALAAVWTGARARGFDLLDVTRWMGAAPARLAGLAARKGSLRPGADADLVLFDPDAAFEVKAEELLHRHPLTPYTGMRLFGRVEQTLVRGVPVYDWGRSADAPSGMEVLA